MITDAKKVGAKPSCEGSEIQHMNARSCCGRKAAKSRFFPPIHAKNAGNLANRVVKGQGVGKLAKEWEKLENSPMKQKGRRGEGRCLDH